MGTQYKSLLGLTEVIADSAEISNIDLEATNITGLTTSRITEGTNLYYTDTRVNNNPNVSSNTTHRDRTDNPHGVTAAQVGIHTSNDIIEGVTNLYYTDIRFDDRLATKTTTSLAEGANLYYTDARFDARLATKSTTNLTEGTNLYYTDARFDTRFGIKTTTNLTEGTNLYYTTTRANADFDARLATKTTTDLTEGTNLYYTDVRFDNRLLSKTTTDLTEGANLYYTDARFDARFGIKTTTNLTEGTNLYYTDARFDARFGIKTTDDLTEGTNLYYTETRVSANTDVKANTDYRAVGHLPLAGGTMAGKLDMGNYEIDNTDRIFIDKYGTGNNKIVLWDNGYVTQTHFYGFGIQAGILVYNAGTEGSHVFYRNGNVELLRINEDGIFSSRDIDIKGNITISGTVDGVDVATLNTNTTNHIENTNNPHGVLASQINDFDTEVSANADVKANTDYRGVGHLPLDGGTLTGNLNMGNNKIITLAAPIADADAANKKYIDDKFRLYEEGKVLAERYSITTYANNTAEMDARFNGKTPNASQYLTNLYTIGWSGEQFGVIYNCYLYVQTAGNITFRGRSDDSSDWFIDDVLVASNYGGHAVGGEPLMTSTVFMTAGFHKSFSRFIEQSGQEGLIHDWDLKGGSNFTTIPTANIFIPKLRLSDITDIGSGAIITTSERADIKTNSEYTAIGHLPLDGGTLTGDLTVDGELNIGGEKIAIGATNGLQLYGPSSDIGGPHIQAFVSTDDYPVFQQLNNSHGSIAMCFDAYADGFSWNSSSNSNAIIYKSNTDLEFSYSSGVVAGGEVIWNAGFSMDLANGLVSFSNGLDVTGDLTISGTVDGVDLKALETAVSSNTAKVSYTDATKVGLISVTQAVNLDTMESDIATNNNKVSASGSISTHSDVNPTLLKDYEVLTYFSGEWKNMPTQAPDTSAFLVVNGTKAMTGNLNMGNNSIDNISKVFVDRKSTSNNKIVLYDGGTPSTTAFYGLGIQSATLLYIVDSSAANHKFYYGGTNEVFRIGNSGVYSYRDLDVKGNIILSGTVDGVDLKALETAVDTNTAKVSASGSINTHSDVNITTPADGHVLTYTGSEWKNIAPAAADGYLPLEGGTMTGPLKLEVSRPTGGWASYLKYTGGTVNGRTYGFLLDANSFYLTAHNDDYSYSHPIMRFDHDGYCYAMKNFSAGTYKVVDVGAPSGPLDATNKTYVDNAVGGRLSLNGGTMKGNLDMGGYNINTVGTVDGYNLDTLNSNINSKLPLSGGTVTGNLATNGFFTANGGSKIVVQNGIEGIGRGIYMWAGNNLSWGIYMATGGGKSFSGGTANKRGNVNSHAIRFRVHNGNQNGFIWENSNNDIIASLDYYGNFVSNGPYSINSDRRKKENFGETFGLEFINKLKPVSYNMINDKKVRHGLIAQEVEEVLAGYDLKFSGLQAANVMIPNPDCKYKDDPEKCTMLDTGEVEYSLSYSEFIAPLIKAVQELSAEVNTLKNRIEILEKPII